ncbi:hypothetical protein [Tolypothrix sp. FACHB-123]|uniref:hypothetical protein n=1 Tax=Tolypothrix sp. FACHB-123 TaxID=2692868 RepID=UPI00168353AB|nr:hypothetical protein [Tolypothrix sp. FACHB-123]
MLKISLDTNIKDVFTGKLLGKMPVNLRGCRIVQHNPRQKYFQYSGLTINF